MEQKFTTIRVKIETLKSLQSIGQKQETYDDIIKKLLYNQKSM